MQVDHVKRRFPGFFSAIHADTRRFPDNGITGAAEATSRNPGTLSNQLKPDNYKEAPTLETALEMIELTQSVRTVNAIASLVGCVAVRVDSHSAPTDIRTCAEVLTQLAYKVVGFGLLEGSTGRLTHTQRDEQECILNELIQMALAYRNGLKG